MKNRSVDIQSNPEPSFSNEEALSLILNNLEDTFLLIDRELKVITTSEHTRHKIFTFFGINIHPGMSILKMAPPERHPSLITLYQEVFEGHERYSESEFRQDGEMRYFENYFKPARNTSGEIVAVVVLAREVTEKRKAQEELRLTEERWRFALEGTKQGVWDRNLETSEIYFSPACQKIYEYEDLSILNNISTWEQIIFPEDRPKVISAFENYISGRTRHYENVYRIKSGSGKIKWILSRGKVITHGPEGKPLRMIGTHTDITDDILKEEELRLNIDRYQHAIMATSDVVWDWDLKTNKILWSDNFTRVLGWELPTDKILDSDFCFTHFHPDDRERLEKSIRTLIEDPSQVNWREEFRYLKADGTYAYVSDKGFTIRDKNNVAIRIIGALEDITARKNNEQLLFLERQIFELSANLEISFHETVEKLLLGFEKIYPEAFSSVLLLKDDETIEPMASLRLPQAFMKALRGIRIGPDVGSCGTAMFHKQTVISEDIDTDPLWAGYRSFTQPYGLKACWSLPIIHSSGKVMGSFAIYHQHKKYPTPEEYNMMERIKNILRILMEHNWSLNEIREANERFDIMMQATHDLIWDWDLDSNIIYRDERGLRKVYGMTSNEPIKGIYQWLGRIHPEDQAKAEDVINDIVQATDEDTFDIEYRFRRDDGTYSYVYDRGVIIRNDEGKPVRMIGAAQDLTERKRLEQELLQNELERQKAINQATVDTQEQERSEIGKELHDNVNQVLTTTKLYLDLASTNAELKDELILKSNQNIVSVINEIRQLSRSLMDPSIGDLGLVDSIHDLIESINLTRKLKVSLKADKILEDLLDKNQKLTVFRIIQETLNNAIRHAKATHVTIQFREDGDSVYIAIQDNGIGFEPQFVKKGAGLKNIQNRIYLINGSHQIQSAPGEGCKIIINFPLNNK